MEPVVLTKGQVLDLKKADGSGVSHARIGVSWDIQDGATVDLDLSVLQKLPGGAKQVVFFGNRASSPVAGVTLSEDNRTGAGDGDDEFATLDATKTADGEYFPFVNIFDAVAKNQSLAMVKSAMVNIYDADTNTKLATFALSEAGGSNTGIVLGKFTDTGDTYSFTAIGNYVNGDINEISNAL